MEELFIPEHVTTAIFENRAVLLDSRKGIYYTLNDSASEFWKALMQLSSFNDVLKEVSKLYNVSPDIIEKDMRNFFNSLVHVGVLKQANNRKRNV